MDKAGYAARKQALLAGLDQPSATPRQAMDALRTLALLTDEALTGLWQAAHMPPHWALAAVGGYGRCELFPNSDVDVLILRPDGTPEPDADEAARATAFITACWDFGLEIGSSLRSTTECLDESARDITVQTSLLESRHLVGDAALTAEMQARYQQALDPKAFYIAKTLEMRQRHNKHESTPYALEPNCKESPGGLRDLHVVLWVAKAAKLGGNWDEMVKRGLLSRFEATRVKRNLALVSLIRIRLHRAARRREDRLVFDLQTQVAEAFGYTAQPPDSAGQARALRASEQLMRRYYWAAKAITQLNQILLLGIEERLYPSTHALRPINERFHDKAGMLEVARDDLYERQPHAILETFLLYQSTVGIKGLSARTLRALYNARGVMNAAFRHDPVNRRTFMLILQQPQGITHAMRLMNQTSVLGRYLWVFRRIVGQMQHDLFHVYTVDQHILMVLRNVRRFFIAEHAHEYPLCSQLAAGWQNPWLLHTAALFHDIAKGRGGDHSTLGEHEARRFCQQHGVAPHDTELIAFLVREHLTMSHVAQKQDLSDPDVIHAFAQRLPNERYLTALYLLTVADIRGTSPKVWNNWKGKLLEDLYRITLRALGGHVPDAHAVIEERKREALVLLALHAMPHQGQARLWGTLGVDYFMRHEAGDIAWHTRHIAKHLALLAADQPVPVSTLVRARPAPHGDGFQVLVYTGDAPDLFARICGYFEQAGFSIQDAKLHGGRNGQVLDTFQVVTGDTETHVRELVGMVEAELPRVIDAAGPLPAPRKGRVSRWVKSFPIAPRIDLRPDERAQHWLLSVSATDRPGLLYGIARVLGAHRLNIELAKIMTLGERVEDSFVISGSALRDERSRIAIETQLLDVLA